MKPATYPSVVAYTFLQPLRKVVKRSGNSAGRYYYDETLECGHTLVKQRGHFAGKGVRYLPQHRRCPLCPPDPPPLKDVEVLLDAAVPYDASSGAKPGFHYVNEAGRVSLRPTSRVRMHPAYHAKLPPEVFQRRRMLRGMWECPWVCEICGAMGKNPGGRATHYRVKHQKEV
jgi:hypothetical protein